jgi:hypothetical protein
LSDNLANSQGVSLFFFAPGTDAGCFWGAFDYIIFRVLSSNFCDLYCSFVHSTPVVTGKTRRAQVLRKQDPCSGRFFRVYAIVELSRLQRQLGKIV